jgi:hypothetical protein
VSGQDPDRRFETGQIGRTNGSGRLQGGRHIATPNPTPLANLIAGLVVIAGLDLGEFENATGVFLTLSEN